MQWRPQVSELIGNAMMLQWVRGHEIALWWLGSLSLVFFFLTLIIIPLFVIHIPVDYFQHQRRKPHPFHERHLAMHLVGLILKNLFGVLFVLAGITMLLLPGQGIITILIGLMLLNFPGKYALERRIVKQPGVLRAINWMRAKAKKPVLQVPKLRLRSASQSIDVHGSRNHN